MACEYTPVKTETIIAPFRTPQIFMHHISDHKMTNFAWRMTKDFLHKRVVILGDVRLPGEAPPNLRVIKHMHADQFNLMLGMYIANTIIVVTGHFTVSRRVAQLIFSWALMSENQLHFPAGHDMMSSVATSMVYQVVQIPYTPEPISATQE